MNIYIKKAETEDEAQQLALIAGKIWHEHYIPIIGKKQTDYMVERFQSEEAIYNDMKSGYVYYMAFADDCLCGYTAVKQDDNKKTVFLSKLYVQKLHRGKGVSKTLLNSVYNYTKACGADKVWLTCNKYNSVSLDIYKKLGFVIMDELETEIGQGYIMDDYILEKSIV